MNDSIIKTLSVAFAVCLVCSLFVSFAAVNLRDTQNLNKINDQRVKVLQAAGIYDEANTNIEEQFSVLEAMFIDFSNNQIVSAIEGLDLDSYDPVEYSRKDDIRFDFLNILQTNEITKYFIYFLIFLLLLEMFFSNARSSKSN